MHPQAQHSKLMIWHKAKKAALSTKQLRQCAETPFCREDSLPPQAESTLFNKQTLPHVAKNTLFNKSALPHTAESSFLTKTVHRTVRKCAAAQKALTAHCGRKLLLLQWNAAYYGMPLFIFSRHCGLDPQSPAKSAKATVCANEWGDTVS
ncbi:MAG: hypothetical protein ACRC3G_03915 [Bacteroidales bacterium]